MTSAKKSQHAALIDLVVVVSTTIVLTIVSLSIDFIDKLYAVFRQSLGMPAFKASINVAFLFLSGLLWLYYRRWRAASARQQELDDVISSINPDTLLVIDSDTRITMCNTSVTTMLGYEPHEVIGQKADLLFTNEVLDGHDGETPLEVLVATCSRCAVGTGKRKNGDTFPVEIISGVTKSRSGAVILLRDISERIAVQRRLAEHRTHLQERTDELERAYAELKQLDAMKDHFLSLVSHELRTPLTSIRSFSEILLNYEEIDRDQVREFLEIINAESQRLTRLINDVLDLARMEAGRMAWNDTVLSIEDIIRDIARTHAALLAQKGLRLSIQIQPDLLPVQADRDRITQVITNLLGNAIKFSPQEGLITIFAESFEEECAATVVQWVRVGIRDEGEGIDPSEHSIIFEKFRQGTSASSELTISGTGLGLPICKEIIEHYGGRIWVESEKGKGSVFLFTFPVIDGDTVQVESSAARYHGCTEAESPVAT